MNATHSEGEILDDKKPLMNEPYLMMLANMKPHKYGVPYMGHHPKMHRDRSLGEVTDYLQQGAKGYGKNGRGRAINVTRQPAEDLESPGKCCVKTERKIALQFHNIDNLVNFFVA